MSGGEQSMAALALIFAIQDYDPSPFYYFDEVDQNLDADNAERIAEMCRQRSKKAQFIMVTLRKVSLRLADHHIGITHGGDGCSRRIVDFDRERAMELSEKYSSSDSELENRISEIAAEKLIEDNNEMPKVPEPLPPPKSLGNLLNHMMESAEEAEETTITSLSERAAETQEDIEERQAISSEIQAIEDEKLSQVLDELISTDEES